MAIARERTGMPLSKAPLVLVLGQARFTPIGDLLKYMPQIQDEFRRHGFPIQNQRNQRQLEISPAGTVKTLPEISQWVFKTKDERSSLIIDGSQVTFQTSNYVRFENYLEQLLRSITIVFKATEHDKFGIVQRLGLRYANCIRDEGTGEQGKSFLRPELHGVADGAFLPTTKRIVGETVGKTRLTNGETGTLVVRIFQNSDGLSIPPDLSMDAPQMPSVVAPGQLATIIDLDHYWTGKSGPPADMDQIENLFWELHEGIKNTFQNHVVTSEAMQAWK